MTAVERSPKIQSLAETIRIGIGAVRQLVVDSRQKYNRGSFTNVPTPAKFLARLGFDIPCSPVIIRAICGRLARRYVVASERNVGG